MKIAVVGMGYVGLSNAVMLSQHNEVSILEICSKKVDKLNKGKSPIKDSLISDYLKSKSLQISATIDFKKAFANAEFIVICTPTNFIESENAFCTSSIDSVIQQINSIGFKGLVIIRSTVPVGYTKKLQSICPNFKIAFFPEFLREGSALYDSLHPSRIICGSSDVLAKKFLNLLLQCCEKKNLSTLITGAEEAEAIKLFSNAYLAIRVAFFNELDSFSFLKNLSAKEIINGVSMDPRIGNTYNNPSFGYGGYCLPKDIKQLAASFDKIPQGLLSAAQESNQKRKKLIAEYVLQHKAKRIGIYKLAMKQGSDNSREAALIDIINMLNKSQKEIFIYEPSLKENVFMSIKVENDFNDFIKNVDLVITNRVTKELVATKKEIFTRDIYNIN